MTRVEFLKQLDYLLQDIDARDRQDALDYYRDYMDEAGVYDYDSVDGLLEIPEKIAMSLRISLNGSIDEQIESGEQGFKSAHAETPGHVPEVYGNYRKENNDGIHDAQWSYESEQNDENEIIQTEKKSSLGKILLIIVLAIVFLPAVLGIGGGLIGIIFGVFGTIIGLVFGVAGGALGALIGGVILFVMSIVHMVTSIPQGIFMMGASLLLIAVGILLVMAVIAICKRFIPWIIRSVVNVFHRIFHKNGGGRA